MQSFCEMALAWFRGSCQRSSGMCTILLGGYWGALGPDFRTVGSKWRPGAQNGARPQHGLCQGGRNVGYKSACHVIETARDGLRRRPDSVSRSPPLQQATSPSSPWQLEASGAVLLALCTPSPFSDGSQVIWHVARLKAGYKWSDSDHFQQPLCSWAWEGGSGTQVRDIADPQHLSWGTETETDCK